MALFLLARPRSGQVIGYGVRTLSDSFSHFCDERLFDDLVDDFSFEFKQYFESLVRPFKDKVLEAIEKIKGWEIEIIAPSHGRIWTSIYEPLCHLFVAFDIRDTGVLTFSSNCDIYKDTTKMSSTHLAPFGTDER